MANAGYSGTPLPQKLGIKAGMTLHVVDAPMDYAALIAPVGTKVAFATRLTRDVEVLHAFATKKGRLEEILEGTDATPAQVAIAWTMRNEGVISIPKASTLAHVTENFGALDVTLTKEDIAVLDRDFKPPRGKQSLEML